MFNKKLILLSIVFIFLFSANIAFAACSNQTQADGTVSLCNPLGEGATKTDIPALLGTVISSVLGVIGSLALVMFIYGGITWMLSAGNQEQVTKGKNILIWATVGIVIIFTAYALVRFVLATVIGTAG
jgi:hypothetical protein